MVNQRGGGGAARCLCLRWSALQMATTHDTVKWHFQRRISNGSQHSECNQKKGLLTEPLQSGTRSSPQRAGCTSTVCAATSGVRLRVRNIRGGGGLGPQPSGDPAAPRAICSGRGAKVKALESAAGQQSCHLRWGRGRLYLPVWERVHLHLPPQLEK